MQASRPLPWGLLILLALLAILAIGMLVSRQTAIQNAALGCDMGLGLQPGRRPVEPPLITSVKFTTFGRAEHLESSLWTDTLRPVWVIGMKGEWLLRGGPPSIPPNPNPVYWYECISVIDALTGQDRSLPVE